MVGVILTGDFWRITKVTERGVCHKHTRDVGKRFDCSVTS